MAKILDSTNGDFCPLDLELGKKTVVSEELCRSCAEAINGYSQPEGFAVICAWADSLGHLKNMGDGEVFGEAFSKKGSKVRKRGDE